MKIVINSCFGGFGLSPAAVKLAVELGVPCKPYPHKPATEEHVVEDLGGGWQVWGRGKSAGLFSTVVRDGMAYYLSDSEIAFRSHPGLVATVEKLGKKANGACAKLEIVDVPDDAEVHIHEYDGSERVHENHRTWG